MNTVPRLGSFTPAADCALPNAVGKSAAMPMTSPVRLHLGAEHGVGSGETGEGQHRLLDETCSVGSVGDRPGRQAPHPASGGRRSSRSARRSPRSPAGPAGRGGCRPAHPRRPHGARQRQGGGAPVRPVRRRRLRARPRDEVHGRGDGHRAPTSRRRSGRRSMAAGVSLPADGRCSSRSRTPTSRQPRSSRRLSRHGPRPIIATRGTAQAISRMGVPVKAINKIGRARPTLSTTSAGATRPGHQHPDGQRSPGPTGYRDPDRRRPPRRPLRDDDDGRLCGRAGHLGPAGERARAALSPGLHEQLPAASPDLAR